MPFSDGSSVVNSSVSRRDILRFGALLGGGTLLSACSSGGSGSGSGSGSPSTSAAAASGSSSGGALPGAGKKIALSLNGNNAYSSYVAEGFYKALEGTGYKVIGIQNNFDSSQELSNVQNLLSQGISGLVVLPADATTIGRAAQLAKRQNIPVGDCLWVQASSADQYFAGVAALDAVAGGKLIGSWLKTNAKPGKVIVVQGIRGQGYSERTDQGMGAALQGSGFTVVVREQGFFSRDTATKIVESGLQAHPDVTAIVSHAASMGDGIASYLKSKNITTVKHITGDCDDEMVDTWLGTPYLGATHYLSAGQSGYLATVAVRAAIEGTKKTFSNPLFQTIMTKANATATIAKVPYRYKQFQAEAAKI